MNSNEALALLQAFGVSYASSQVQVIVSAYQSANPGATSAQVVSAVDGSLKHELRSKIAWGADLLWPFVSPVLDPIIAADVAAGLAGSLDTLIAALPATTANPT